VIIGILVQFLWSSIVSVVLYKLSKSDRNVEDLQESLHEATEKLVDERFRRMSHEVNGSVQGLLSTLNLVQQQVRDGEEDFKQLGSRDQKIELEVAGKFGEVKDWMRETFASKEDVREHEKHVTDRIDRHEKRVHDQIGKLEGKIDQQLRKGN
jgi:hypothetical protein